ncbi:MAG: TetR/AcrR family transcriptional regulator [Myxococcales bacterium FL481]|nr:MAG: TetR/AcrR family transcriptional regulator [Myxococcales bacterium FL481]
MSPRPGHAGRELRDAIMRAATRLFADQGFAATSIRQIVEACRCTNPSLYYYFPSKDDLYRKVVEAHIAQVTQFIRDCGNQPGSVRDRLRGALVILATYGRQYPESFRLLHRIDSNAQDRAPDVDVSGARRVHLELMSHILEQGVESGEIRATVDPTLAALALAGIVHFQLQHAMCTGAWDEDTISRTLDLLFDGIAA